MIENWHCAYGSLWCENTFLERLRSIILLETGSNKVCVYTSFDGLFTWLIFSSFRLISSCGYRFRYYHIVIPCLSKIPFPFWSRFTCYLAALSRLVSNFFAHASMKLRNYVRIIIHSLIWTLRCCQNILHQRETDPADFHLLSTPTVLSLNIPYPSSSNLAPNNLPTTCSRVLAEVLHAMGCSARWEWYIGLTRLWNHHQDFSSLDYPVVISKVTMNTRTCMNCKRCIKSLPLWSGTSERLPLLSIVFL